jgi:hypothetical protein
LQKKVFFSNGFYDVQENVIKVPPTATNSENGFDEDFDIFQRPFCNKWSEREE